MIRAFSYGGGVQSTAALVLAARGLIDYPLFIFANVGEDSERPETIAYVHDVAMPYAAEQGLELVELRKTLRDGTTQTLMQRIEASERSIPIPVRMGDDGAPGNRTGKKLPLVVDSAQLVMFEDDGCESGWCMT